MQFDIEDFYLRRGIDFIRKGTNVKKGEINVSCPFCNSSSNPDPSYHLGVDPNTGYWSCWRNRKHRGKRLQRLIMKLLSISYAEACEILGQKVDWIREGSFNIFNEDFDTSKLFNDEQEAAEEKILELDPNIRPFTGFRSELPFLKYLTERGFHRNHLNEVIKEYDLHYCINGPWQNRIIAPIKLDYKLVSWTGRHLQKDASLRYRSLSEKEGALISIKDTILNFDELMNTGGDSLFVCEGPFDGFKLDFYAKDDGSRATALFSKALREPQAILLSELSMVFKKIVLLLDAEELEATLTSDSTLAFLGAKIEMGELPKGFHDPGELTPSAVYKLVERYN